MNTTTQTNGQRFQPNAQMAFGMAIGYGLIAAVFVATIDFFKMSTSRSIIRSLCVAGLTFVATAAFCWFRTIRRGCSTLTLAEQGLTIEDNTRRDVLPWSELEEITVDRNLNIKFKSRNRREPLCFENMGFSADEWKAIKDLLTARGYELKPEKLSL
jgi:hypothetical protein